MSSFRAPIGPLYLRTDAEVIFACEWISRLADDVHQNIDGGQRAQMLRIMRCVRALVEERVNKLVAVSEMSSTSPMVAVDTGTEDRYPLVEVASNVHEAIEALRTDNDLPPLTLVFLAATAEASGKVIAILGAAIESHERRVEDAAEDEPTTTEVPS